MNGNETFRIRLTHTNTETSKTWVEWIGLSKTGKAMRKANEKKATSMTREQATAHCDRLNAELAALQARLTDKTLTSRYEVV